MAQVGAERDALAAAVGQEHGRPALHDHQTEAGQGELFNDCRPDRGSVGEQAAGVETGMELVAGSQAAGRFAAFEYGHLAAGPGQHAGRGQTVVASADDDGVVFCVHNSPDTNNDFAANYPGAPMMPPPGWVADPHIHKPRKGVL